MAVDIVDKYPLKVWHNSLSNILETHLSSKLRDDLYHLLVLKKLCCWSLIRQCWNPCQLGREWQRWQYRNDFLCWHDSIECPPYRQFLWKCFFKYLFTDLCHLICFWKYFIVLLMPRLAHQMHALLPIFGSKQNRWLRSNSNFCLVLLHADSSRKPCSHHLCCTIKSCIESTVKTIWSFKLVYLLPIKTM